MRPTLKVLLAVLLVVAGDIPRSVLAAGDDPYRFGVFPYLSAARLEAIYAPMSTALSRAIGRPVQFRTSSRFERFFARLEKRDYDIVLIQPFWYPPAVDRFGYSPLARIGEPLTSVVTVLDESPLREPGDLVGTTIATPPAFVPVVHMARKALADEGLTPGEDVALVAFKTVDSCFQQVLIGAASACVAPSFAPATIAERMNVRLRVLLESEPIPNLSFLVHPRVPSEERERLEAALLSWKPGGPGSDLLEAMKTRGLVPIVDAEYDPVRSMLRDIESAKRER